ncbi:MAG: hypothetical protein M1822_000099 [Bathelium mastoideum]|nr:MAG: hypothetical protein M1822_000099 [Bathelium mastoideum]
MSVAVKDFISLPVIILNFNDLFKSSAPDIDIVPAFSSNPIVDVPIEQLKLTRATLTRVRFQLSSSVDAFPLPGPSPPSSPTKTTAFLRQRHWLADNRVVKPPTRLIDEIAVTTPAPPPPPPRRAPRKQASRQPGVSGSGRGNSDKKKPGRPPKKAARTPAPRKIAKKPAPKKGGRKATRGKKQAAGATSGGATTGAGTGAGTDATNVVAPTRPTPYQRAQHIQRHSNREGARYDWEHPADIRRQQTGGYTVSGRFRRSPAPSPEG